MPIAQSRDSYLSDQVTALRNPDICSAMPYAGLSKKAVKPAVVGVSILACFFILYGIMEQRKQSLTYFVGKSQRQATRERPSNSNAVAHEGTNGGGNNQEMDDSEEWENSIERVHYSSNDDDISRHDLLDGGNRLRPQAHSGHETHGNATKKGAFECIVAVGPVSVLPYLLFCIVHYDVL